MKEDSKGMTEDGRAQRQYGCRRAFSNDALIISIFVIIIFFHVSAAISNLENSF